MHYIVIFNPLKQKNTDRANEYSIFSCTSATVWHELWNGVKLLNEGKRKIELESYLNILSVFLQNKSGANNLTLQCLRKISIRSLYG